MGLELGAACMVEEEKRFHGLPPLKRFKILEKERVGQKREKETVVRRRTEEVNLQKENEVGTHGVKVCCLPAKKRVWALQIFTALPDEEEEQESRTMVAKKKTEARSLTARALQPINSNWQVTASIKPDEKSHTGKEMKKTRESSCVITRASLQPTSNRQVLVPTEHAEKCPHMPLTVEEVHTEERQHNEVKLVKNKRGDISAATNSGVTNSVLNLRQQPVARKGEGKITSAGEGEIERNLSRIRRHASLVLTTDASLNFSQMLVATEGNALFNLQMSMASVGEEQQKKTEDVVQPIHDLQVPVATMQTENVANIDLKEECAADEGEEESDGEDDGVFCDVCKEADAEPSDPIVFCDGCNVMVHASCYGSPLIDGIPAGDWFCRQCESESRRKVEENRMGSHVGFHVGQRTHASRVCCLCPSRKGAMKQTTGGAWAHLSCALFVPEVFYKRARDREGIECCSVPAWRWEMPCVVCSTRGQGSCIQCTEVGCSSTFHVSCALDAGLTIDYRNANALTKTPAIVIAFCPSHSSQALTRSERRRFKIVPRG